MRRYKQVGLKPEFYRPHRIPMLEHHCTDKPLERCRRCDGQVRQDGRQFICVLCGRDWFLVVRDG